MRLFRRRKKEKKNVSDVLAPITEDILPEEDRADSGKVHHYVLGHCEQIIQTAKDLEEEKAEYRALTSYLTDIQIIDALSERETQNLKDTANSILTLTQSREDFLNMGKKITESDFVQMQRDEDTVTETIRSLQANEAYQNAIRRDMNYLEGEKVEWTYYRQELKDEQKLMRKLSYVAFALLVAALTTLMVMLFLLNMDVMILFAVLLFVSAVTGSFLLLRMQNNGKEIRRSEANINRAISLLNRTKIKYVHCTNAVDYVCEKYHVHNSGELNDMWERYMEAVREREMFEKNNDDLEYFSGRLIRILQNHDLHDPKIWLNQLHGLTDKRELVEITHELIDRRKKVRKQMDYDMEVVKEQKAEIEGLMEEFHEEIPEVREILNSIDRLSQT